MSDRESTARSRELGAQLRRVRERAGYSAAELARRLGWSPSRISRLETGKRGAAEPHVLAVLVCCGVTGAELDDLLGLCRNAYDRSWLRFHRNHIDEEHTLVLHETSAVRVSEYEPLAIPDLLQTRDYAYSLLQRVGLEADDAFEARVRARLNRQALFQQEHPPNLVFFIPEHVLRSPTGGPHVMNDQLRHLVLMASRPLRQLRVLPSSISARVLLGGPFRLMEFSDHPPLAYVRNHTTSLFLEEPDDIGIYRAILHQLAERALGEEQSRRLLVRLATLYDTTEPRGDDQNTSPLRLQPEG